MLERIERVVGQAELTSEQFAALDKHLDRIDQGVKVRPAIIGYRAAAFTAAAHTLENPELFDRNEQTRRVAFVLNSRFRQPRAARERADLLKSFTELADAIDLPAEAGTEAILALER